MNYKVIVESISNDDYRSSVIYDGYGVHQAKEWMDDAVEQYKTLIEISSNNVSMEGNSERMRLWDKDTNILVEVRLECEDSFTVWAVKKMAKAKGWAK